MVLNLFGSETFDYIYIY